jgi:hypothetical protein
MQRLAFQTLEAIRAVAGASLLESMRLNADITTMRNFNSTIGFQLKKRTAKQNRKHREQVDEMRLRDAVLHLRTRHTAGLQALSRMLAHHGRGSKPCPLCDSNTLAPHPIGHLLAGHQREMGLHKDHFTSVEHLLN